jgi:hypothetical protein
MLRLITILGFTACFLGCGGNNDKGDGGGGSGGTGGGDLSASMGDDMAGMLPPDLQPAYGCHELAACEDACTDAASCMLCTESATMMARTLYRTATRCVQRECYPVPDGGPAPCSFNGGGTPSADCTACLTDSIKMSGSCGADTTYCGACYTQYAACEANTP